MSLISGFWKIGLRIFVICMGSCKIARILSPYIYSTYRVCHMSYISVLYVIYTHMTQISVNCHLQNQQEILAVNFLLKNGNFFLQIDLQSNALLLSSTPLADWFEFTLCHVHYIKNNVIIPSPRPYHDLFSLIDSKSFSQCCIIE